MNDRPTPAVNKLPFLFADLLLLGLAGIIVQQYPHPLNFRLASLCVGLVILGAIFSVIPFLLEYKSAVRLAESEKLNDAVSQINQLDTLAKQISSATAQWQDVQNAAGKTTTAAKEIAARMDEELKGFTEFMQKANDSEKGALRLEVEKLRRAEGEWVQVLVRVLDHIFALHQAGVRSGQAELIHQLGQFQHACRDAARRIGLTPFAPAPDEAFDAARHKLPDSETAPADARIGETLAPGFTYQGRLLRPALVKLKTAESAPAQIAAEPDAPAPTAEPSLF